MRRAALGFALLASGLLAQAPLRILAVERRGPPPYEPEGRIYRLEGGRDRGLKPGDRLIVRRDGEAEELGHLILTVVRGEQSEARFQPRGGSHPLVGDLAHRQELKGMPSLEPSSDEPLPVLSVPRPAAPAPPREGLLFFLPQNAELSPAGLQKLEGWVRAWGPGGRWAVQVPAAKGLRPALQKARAEALVAALTRLGIPEVQVQEEPRTTDGRYDPAWVRHWD